MSRAITIRRIEDGVVVRRIDVSGKTDRQIERIEDGLSINFNFDDFMFGVEEERDSEWSDSTGGGSE
jgi:hypothetical protein